MKTYLRLTALLITLLTALPALADGGSINFEGQVVESACTVNATPTAGSDTVPVTAHINLQIRPENDACSRGYMAFTTSIGTLATDETGVNNNVITVTYN